MKKYKFIVFILALTILLTGCAQAPPEEETRPKPDNNETEEEIIQAPDIEVDISELIHVNQVGYRPDDYKIAVISGYSGQFQVIRASDNEVVYDSQTSERPITDVSTGDTVHFADFSGLRETGAYFISVPGIGRSFDFKIEENVYEDLKRALLKFMYYQRCGVELLPEHAGPWARRVCHLEDGYILGEDEVFKEAVGGWHDAGDFGKYSVPVAVTLAAMLKAYELFPNVFGDDTDIPESGNGVPDILDESVFAIEWLMKMQDQATGGVYHKLSTRNFPGFIMPHLDLQRRYLTAISPTATGAFSAIMAAAARIFADKDEEFAGKALNAAKLAWDWLISNPDAPNYVNPPGIHTGEYGDWNNADERYWAAVELYRVTGDEKYHEFALNIQRTGNFELFDFGWQSVAGFGSVSYLLLDSEKCNPEFFETLKEELISNADHYVRMSGFNGYKISLTQHDYFWGSNMLVMNRAVHLIMAYLSDGNSQYRNTALDHLHYLLGRNSLGRSFVTGFGSNPPMFPHHRPSGADNVDDPVPGMVVGGPNSRLQDPTAESLLKPGMPPARAYIDKEGSWSTNEVTTYWNSPALFVTAFFSNGN